MGDDYMVIIEKMLSMVNEKGMGSIIQHYTDERYHEVNMTDHLAAWAQNKKHIFELFGNSLKIEMPVETQLPYTLVKEKLKTFLEEEFAESKYSIIKVFLRAVAAEEIGGNVLMHDFQMFDTPFKKGMKISKCFRHLIKKEWLDEANIKYSMFLQSLKAKGTAVLSIDPIDFLTMSANNSGWRSCHAPDGEYRTGQVAYMMDETSVISYVKASEDCTLPDGTVHANKIWRQICLINPNNTYALQARQYPAVNDANSLTVGKMLTEAIEKWTGEEYKRHESNSGDRVYYDLQDSHDGSRHLYYNDIEHSAFETGYMIIPASFERENFVDQVGKADKKYPLAVVGDDVPCLCGCGNWLGNAEHYFVENSCYYDNYDYDC